MLQRRAPSSVFGVGKTRDGDRLDGATVRDNQRAAIRAAEWNRPEMLILCPHRWAQNLRNLATAEN